MRIGAVSDDAGRVGGRGTDDTLRVVVIDDHEVLRAGTRQVLETTDDIVVVGEADTWDTAVAVDRPTATGCGPGRHPTRRSTTASIWPASSPTTIPEHGW